MGTCHCHVCVPVGPCTRCMRRCLCLTLSRFQPWMSSHAASVHGVKWRANGLVLFASQASLIEVLNRSFHRLISRAHPRVLSTSIEEPMTSQLRFNSLGTDYWNIAFADMNLLNAPSPRNLVHSAFGGSCSHRNPQRFLGTRGDI